MSDRRDVQWGLLASCAVTMLAWAVVAFVVCALIGWLL